MAMLPIMMEWDGEVLRPASKYWARQADDAFVVGERHRIVEEHPQSDQSRKHEFAWLREAWNSLPDDLLEKYPSEEHLRKRGLIAKGWCTITDHACGTEAEAKRTEASIRKHVDTYAVVTRSGSVVRVSEALSQSRRSMPAAKFQQSKNDLMDYVAALLGVDAETLGRVQEAA